MGKKGRQRSRDRKQGKGKETVAYRDTAVDPSTLQRVMTASRSETRASELLALQRTAGNRAVQRMLARQQEGAGPETEFTKKPTLRRGSQGPAVTDLQSRLNSLGAQPALVLDGIFGAGVHAAVLSFQRANDLMPDGVCGGNTWAALIKPGAKRIDPDLTKQIIDGIDDFGDLVIPGWGDVPGPGADGPPDKGGAGLRVAGIASLQVGLIDYSQLVPSLDDPDQKEPFGWRHLDQIYQKGANVKWPASELKKSWRPGKVDWCAIFAVFCYQLAGLDATWILGAGAKGSVNKVWPWDKASRQEFEASIRPGDIAAVAAKQHHFVVVSVDQQSGLIESVDGNQEWGQIRARTKHKLSDVVAYYTPI